jgi:Ran GTPase-activating protein 1
MVVRLIYAIYLKRCCTTLTPSNHEHIADADHDFLACCSPQKIADFADIFTGRLISEIPQALQALCNALVGLKKLVEVDLSDNAFGGRVAEPMVNFLTKNLNFKVLRLTNNGMGPAGGTVIAKAILENANASSSSSAATSSASSSSASITTVICGRNRLENGSAPFFADAYSALGSSLREVRMVQNGIRMEGIAALAKGLRKCPNLEVLDLQDNTAAVVGSRAIANSLKYWPKLKHLNLSDCLLRPKGAILIMQALKEGHNKELESLKLQSDEVDTEAVQILAEAVKLHLTKLSAVELNGNRVEPDDDSTNNLREALQANGFENAIDEIDDVEEVDEDEEEEEEAELESEDEDEQAAMENLVVSGQVETGGEDVRADEAQVVRQDKVGRGICTSVNVFLS